MPLFNDPVMKNPLAGVLGTNNSMLRGMNGNTPDGFSIRYIRFAIENYVAEHPFEFENVDLSKLSISAGFSVSEQSTRFVISYRDDALFNDLLKNGAMVAGMNGPVVHAVDFLVSQESVDDLGWQAVLDNRMPTMLHAVKVVSMRVTDALSILRDLGPVVSKPKRPKLVELPELDEPSFEVEP